MRSNGWFVVRAWILVVAFGLNVMPASAQPQQVSPGETYSTMMVAYVDPEIFPPTALEQLAKIVAADEKSLAKALGQESVQGAQLSLNAIPGSGSAVAIVARLHMGPTLKTASEKIQQACFESLKNRISERLRMFYLMRREQLQKQLEELVVRQKKGLSEIRDLRSQTSGPSPTALTEAFVSARAALEQAQTQKDVQEARRVTLMKSLAEIQAKKPGKDPVIEQLQLIVDLKRANFERAKLVSEKSKSIAPSELTQLQEEMAKSEAKLRIQKEKHDK